MNEPLRALQLETIARIQAAISNINRLRVSINDALESDGIPARHLSLHELGMLAHELEGLLFEHELSENSKAA